jgi:hypothetical protein
VKRAARRRGGWGKSGSEGWAPGPVPGARGGRPRARKRPHGGERP